MEEEQRKKWAKSSDRPSRKPTRQGEARQQADLKRQKEGEEEAREREWRRRPVKNCFWTVSNAHKFGSHCSGDYTQNRWEYCDWIFGKEEKCCHWYYPS
jgi:hypothetical protein